MFLLQHLLQMESRAEYNNLLDAGELLEMYPELSGVWQEDKNRFLEIWEQNAEAIKHIDVDYNEYE